MGRVKKMSWIKGWPQVTIAQGERGPTIYSVDRKGRLLIQGNDWKEPWNRPSNRFNVRGYKDAWDFACKLGSPKRAREIAERVQAIIEAEESP